MIKYIYLLLISFISLSSNYSQCNFVLINSETNNLTINGNSITSCLNQAYFTINLENISPFYLSNIEVTIDLPDGINYISGSSNNATEINILDLNEPVFALTDIDISTTNNNILSFTIEVNATCSLQNYLDAGGIVQNIVSITNDATNNGSTINCTTLHTSQVYTALVPNLSITNISEQSHVGNVGETFQRCISIINGGSGGLTQFYLKDEHGASIGISSVDLGVVVVNGLIEEILLSGADFVTIGNGDSLFDPGESIVICETVEILSCGETNSVYTYSWGCNNENCQELTDGANVTFPGEIPEIKMQRYNSFRDSHGSWSSELITDDTLCFTSDGVYQSGVYITNTGSGMAYNVLAKMNSAHNYSSSGFDVSNIRMTYNGVPQPFHRDSLINPTHYGSSWSSCLPVNSVGNIDYLLDSVAPGDTIYIEWDWYTCFQINDCTNSQKMLIWYYEASYENKCSQEYEIPSKGGSSWAYFNHNFTLDTYPATIIGNSTFNMSYVNESWNHNIPRNIANDQFRFELVIPSCLGFDPSSFHITTTNGIIYSPNSSISSGDTINLYYTDLPDPNGGILNESTIDFDISIDCSNCSSGSYSIELSSFYTPNMILGCDNELTMGCNSHNVSLFCPEPCTGINFNQYYAKRINLGLPDNDNNGLPDPAGVIDYTQIRTDRMIFGDTLQILHGGNVINSLNDSIWPYIYAETNMEMGGNLFSYVNAEFTLYQVATGTYHTAIITTAPSEDTSGTTKHFEYVLDINALVFDTPLPSNYSLQNQDSVFLTSNYKVTKNIGDGIVIVNTENRFYCSHLSSSPDVLNQFGCAEIISNFTVFGFHFNNYSNTNYYTESCNSVKLSQNYSLDIAGAPGAKNKFKNEYRPFAHPQNLIITLPDTYTYESAEFKFVRTTGVNSTSSSSGNLGSGSVAGGWFPLTPSSVIGNEYSFNTDIYFGDDPLNDSIIYGDEGFYGTIRFNLIPNCTIEEDISKNVIYAWEYETVPQFYGTTNDTASSITTSNYYLDDTIISPTETDMISYDKPSFTLQSNLISQNIPSNTAEWNVSITNNSNTSGTSNSWFGLPTTGTIVGDSLLDITNNIMIYPTATGIFHVGDINVAQILNYTIYTHINGCVSDSIVLHHGWDCIGYPIDIDSHPCNTLTKTLFITPLMPELSNHLTLTKGDTMGLCDTASFEIEVIDFQLGNAFDLITSLTIPTGMIIEPNSCYIKYPESGIYIPIPNPINIFGNNWRWDISALEATINANGLQGILDQTLNKYYLSFNCLVDCDFVSGSRVTCLTTGTAKCGRPINSNVGVSNQIFIEDALPPYNANITINTTYLTPCLGSTLIELIIVNEGPQLFGVNDSVYFRLNNGINYDANSFIGILNAPINGTPSFINNNGIQNIAWNLPQGLGVGDTTKFSFTINGLPSDLECGVLQLLTQITTNGGAVCSTTGSFCNINISTADALKNIFIYKGYLDISNSNGSYATPNAPSGEIGNISFDIFNTGETISTGTETIIQYYQDTDNNGIFSLGDLYITNDTIQDELTGNSSYSYSGTIDIPGGMGCSLIAIIDTSLNPCTCVSSQVLIHLPLHSPYSTHSICTTDTVLVGLDSISNYTYSWSSIANLSNSLIAQPNFNVIINYPLTDSFELVRTIDRGACTTTDTTIVSVQSLPVSLAGIDQELCDTTSTTLLGNEPQGIASGMWIVDPNFIQPTGVLITNTTLYNTTITALQEGVYQLLWVVSNDFCNPVIDTVQIKVYNQPEADANLDQSICNDSVVFFMGNEPQGSATGEWLISTSFIQSSPMLFTDSSLYNTAGTELIAGAYQFVWTQSNGTCPQSKDTMQVNVYNLPFVNAGANQNLCDTNATNLDGNIPGVFCTGLWSIDSNFTQPSIVNFSDITSHNSMISNLHEGIYQLIWTLSNGVCPPVKDTMVINVFNNPIANAGPNQELCARTFTNLTANNPLGTATGLWSMDANHNQPSAVIFNSPTTYNTEVSGLISGTYQFVWTVSNGICSAETDTLIVIVYDLAEADAGEDQVFCEEFTTVLEGSSPTGTATGLWSIDDSFGNPSQILFYDAIDSNATASNFQEGVYQLIWTISNGSCPSSSDTVVIMNYKFPISNFNIDDQICSNECLTANDMSYVHAPYLITGYHWIINGEEQDQTPQFEGLFCFPDSGAYNLSLIIETNKGCVDTSDVQNTVTVMPLPEANFSYNPESAITELIVVQFTDESIGASIIHYDFGNGMQTDSLNPVYWYTNEGVYDITQIVISEYGCIDTIIKEIQIGKPENLYIPNTFTPNGDGLNDLFYPVNKGIVSKDYSLYIFNRWGELIFESHDPSEGWDGFHNNKEVQIGVYVWKLNYFSNVTKESIVKRGHVNVLK